MSSFFILSIIVAVLVIATRTEYLRHQRFVDRIPHRIHVNGTRGKSSVTRLIGAGLRAGNVAAITKVTGTFPRLILADGSEVPVHRKAEPSILEQLRIVEFAVQRRARALVIECMALDPLHQRITEQQMVRSTLAVMTNIRLDHTDVMGRTLEEIGTTMANTIPLGGEVLTSEDENADLLSRIANKRGARTTVVPTDVSQAEMAGFGYIEHRANVALALAVCDHVGVDRRTALRGMWQAAPDAGVLTRATVREGAAATTLFNAFAANDPDSTLLIWQMLRDEGHLRGRRFVLLNSRPDRKDRSEQLAHLAATRLDADVVFAMGQPTEAVVRCLESHGMSKDRIVDLGKAQPDEVYRAILDRTSVESSVVAIGNMGGYGAATIDWFAERSRVSHG